MNWNGWIAERCIASSPHHIRVLFVGIFFRDLINLLLYVKRLHYGKQSAMYVLSLFLRSDQWLMLIADIHRPSSADELLLYIRKEKFYVMIVVFYVTMVAFLAPGLKILQSSH